MAVFFGVQLIVAGIFRFVAAVAADELTGGPRARRAVRGLNSLILGLYAVRHVLITSLALSLLLGIFWIINGAAELFMALSRQEMTGRAWTVLMGVLSVLAGLIVLIYPAISLLTLAVVLGIWLLVQGGMQIALAFQARSARHRVRPGRRVPVM